MSTNQEWHDALADWYSTLVEAAAIYKLVGAEAHAVQRAEAIYKHVERWGGFLDVRLPKRALPVVDCDARNAVQDGAAIIARLAALRERVDSLDLGTIEATPSTVEFLRGIRAQARQLGLLRTRLRSAGQRLPAAQFSARVPDKYALALVESKLPESVEAASRVMAGITVLYEADVPSGYVAAAVDVATLDSDRAERVVSAYRANVAPEYVGELL